MGLGLVLVLVLVLLLYCRLSREQNIVPAFDKYGKAGI
jgi:hypothetical protein